MEDGSDVPGLQPARQDVAMPRHVEEKIRSGATCAMPRARPCTAAWAQGGKNLKCIPRPVRAGFFQFAKGTSSVDAIVESMASMLENAHYWEDVQEVGGEYHHGGGFLPLGAWKTLGFEAAHIEKISTRGRHGAPRARQAVPRAVTRHPKGLFEGQLETASGHHRSEHA